jgi:hypothetical protein
MGKRWPIMSAVDKLPVHLGKKISLHTNHTNTQKDSKQIKNINSKNITI